MVGMGDVAGSTYWGKMDNGANAPKWVVYPISCALRPDKIPALISTYRAGALERLKERRSYELRIGWSRRRLCEDQSPPLWDGNRITELSRRVDPEADGLLGIG